MGYKIDEIEGIGPEYAKKLATVEITTTEQLLELCCQPAGRKQVSEKAELSEKLILKWANHADLMRISGIGPEFAELLEASGVDTVKELRNRNAENLTAKMAEVNGEKNLTRALPAESVVSGWIDAAKSTDPKMEY